MKNQNEHLWDGEGYEAGHAFDLKYEEWEQRDWMTWLAANLIFPFNVTRKEDEDDAYFQKGADKAPFRLGHTMDFSGIR